AGAKRPPDFCRQLRPLPSRQRHRLAARPRPSGALQTEISAQRLSRQRRAPHLCHSARTWHDARLWQYHESGATAGPARLPAHVMSKLKLESPDAKLDQTRLLPGMAVIALWMLVQCGIGLIGVFLHKFPIGAVLICIVFAI